MPDLPSQQPRARPPRSQVDPAALALLERHGQQILATARRYSSNAEDAEDAFQRAFEILLTKAPTTHEQELIPWLKTVVKHEAFAIRRQRERHTPVSDDGELDEAPTALDSTHDEAERYEQLLQGAEALNRLKPQEVRALLLKAEGYSYREICQITGWSYTKTNRCLTEGRVALTRRLSEIRSGAECERFAPLISALVDGEAAAAELPALRSHLRTCLTCRSRLREFRAAPARVAALAPPAALAGADGGGTLRGLLESLLGAAQHKAAAVGERAHAAIELASAQKAAAVAASTVALAGGGAALDTVGERPGPAVRARAVAVEPARAQAQHPAPVPAGGQVLASQPSPAPAQAPTPRMAVPPSPRPAPQSPTPAPAPDPAREFAPVPATNSEGAPTPAAVPQAATARADPPRATGAPDAAPGGERSGAAPGGGGRSGGEFGP